MNIFRSLMKSSTADRLPNTMFITIKKKAPTLEQQKFQIVNTKVALDMIGLACLCLFCVIFLRQQQAMEWNGALLETPRHVEERGLTPYADKSK